MLEGSLVVVMVLLYVAFLVAAFSARPALALALLWLLIPMSWRIVDAAYIDLAGPVYSEQLSTHVGPGTASALLVLDLIAVLAVFALVLPRPIRRPDTLKAAFGFTMEKLGVVLLIGTTLLLVSVYIEVFSRGVLPILARIERYDYATDYAGPLYRLLLRFGDPLAMFLGCMAVYPVFFGRSVDRRFLYLLIAMLVVAFLTGHRFSAFFKFCTLFALAFGAVGLRESVSIRGLRASRPLFAVLLIGSLIAAPAILLSYFSTRFDDPSQAWYSITQRVLVQQAELWWITHERVVDQNLWSLSPLLERLFVSPIDASRNTTIQWLMEAALGQDAARLIGQNTQYAGGFPEIFHEAFGPSLGVLAVVAATAPAAYVLRTFLLAVVRGRPLTMLASGMLLYPFQIMFWGGMLNFLLAWTFWAKLALFAAALILESQFFARISTRLLSRTALQHGH